MGSVISLTHVVFPKERSGLLTSLQLVGMGRGVACGMVYLSEMNVIHRVSSTFTFIGFLAHQHLIRRPHQDV